MLFSYWDSCFSFSLDILLWVILRFINRNDKSNIFFVLWSFPTLSGILVCGLTVQLYNAVHFKNCYKSIKSNLQIKISTVQINVDWLFIKHLINVHVQFYLFMFSI